MKKTENYAYMEAYAQGYKDALSEFDDAVAAVMAWFETPEYELAVALNKYKKDIGKA